SRLQEEVDDQGRPGREAGQVSRLRARHRGPCRAGRCRKTTTTDPQAAGERRSRSTLNPGGPGPLAKRCPVTGRACRTRGGATALALAVGLIDDRGPPA